MGIEFLKKSEGFSRECEQRLTIIEYLREQQIPTGIIKLDYKSRHVYALSDPYAISEKCEKYFNELK